VHGGGRFRRVLFATDFTDASLAATPYAISLAQENKSKLVLLHAMRTPQELNDEAGNDYEWERFELSVAEAIHRLYETVPKDADLHFPP
jgi:nucleotide-binding universal stress UspA family protein